MKTRLVQRQLMLGRNARLACYSETVFGTMSCRVVQGSANHNQLGKQMNKVTACLAAALAATSGIAYAAPGPDVLRPYLDLGITYIPQDHDERHSDWGGGLFAGGGVPLNKWFTIEGDMYYDKWSRDSAPNDNRWKEYGAEGQGLLTFPLGNGWVPFLSAGIGVTQSRLSGDGKSIDMAYSAGSGVFYLFNAFNRDWGLRFDARYRLTDLRDGIAGHGHIDDPNIDDHLGEAVIRFGVLTMLGKRPEPAPVTPPPPPPAAPVDGDSDGDGVRDSVDQCPGTPAGVKVDAKGCPETTELGSPANALAHYGPIYFDFDQSALKPAEKAKLDAALKEIKGMKNPKIIIKLDGHTDSIGTTEYNQALGERRATVVKNYLLAKGVKAERIELNSYGESKPVASNDTDEGRALNRRVEVLVVDE